MKQVILLHGLGGSNLVETATGKQVWGGIDDITRGRWHKLRMNPDGTSIAALHANGLTTLKGNALAFASMSAAMVRAGYLVTTIAWDWRLLPDAALSSILALLPTEPYFVVGHSYGGLLARRISTADTNCAGFVQVGSPNYGSFSAVEGIAMFDLVLLIGQALNIIQRKPSLMTTAMVDSFAMLMPFHLNNPTFYSADTWASGLPVYIRSPAITSYENSFVSQVRLNRVINAQNDLLARPINYDRSLSVFNDKIQTRDYDRTTLQVIRKAGDGTVSSADAFLLGGQQANAGTLNHANLMADTEVQRAVINRLTQWNNAIQALAA